MFWADLPRYVRNPAFIVKMGLLLLALAQHFTMRYRQGRWAAALSLILWSAVILAGRAIADFDLYHQPHAAMRE
jgi:hypothetical protein